MTGPAIRRCGNVDGMAGRVLLVRHAETALNADGRIRGWLDVPLDASGHVTSLRTGKRIAGAYVVHRVYCSALMRAMDTAEAIARATGATMAQPEVALRPWNVGEFAGQPARTVMPEMIRLSYAAAETAPGGESFSRFAIRYLGRLLQICRETRDNDTCVAVVQHTRNMQVARGWVAAGAKNDLEYDPAVVNDYSHEIAPGDWLVLGVT